MKTYVCFSFLQLKIIEYIHEQSSFFVFSKLYYRERGREKERKKE